MRSWICWFKILLMLYLLFEVSAFFRLPTRLLRYKKTRTTTAATTTTTTAKPKIRPHGFHHFHHHFGPRPYPDYFHRPPYTFYRYNGNQGRYTKPAPTTTTTTTTTAKPKGYSAHDHHFHYYPIPATPFYGGRNFFNPRRYNYDNRHGYQGHYGYKLPYFDNNSGLRRYKSTTTTTEAPPTTTEAPTTTTTKAPYVVPYNIYGDFAGYRQLQIQPYPYVYQPSSSKVTTTKVRAPKNYNVHVISSEAPNSRTSVAKHLPQRSDPRTFGTGTRLLYGSLGHPAIIIDQDSDLYDEIFWLVSDAYSSTSNSDGETSTTEASEPATTNVSNMETMANSTMKMAAITKAMRMPSEVTTMAAEEQMETRTGAAVATQSTSQPVTTEATGESSASPPNENNTKQPAQMAYTTWPGTWFPDSSATSGYNDMYFGRSRSAYEYGYSDHSLPKPQSQRQLYEQNRQKLRTSNGRKWSPLIEVEHIASGQKWSII